jgi:hypothetical protein
MPRLRISFPQLRRRGDSKQTKNPGGNPGLDEKSPANQNFKIFVPCWRITKKETHRLAQG